MGNAVRRGIIAFCSFWILFLFSIGAAEAEDWNASLDDAVSLELPSLINDSFGNSEPSNGPISQTYSPPSGVMPIIVLKGSPYEMGYQYGLQAKDYIALVRDAAWASALSRSSSSQITNTCNVYRRYISAELTQFNFSAFFLGMSDSMNDQGVKFSPTDAIVMLYWGARQGPKPPEDHCTAMLAFGKTAAGKMIAAENFDYYQVPSNTYSVILALYPDDGNACIIPSGAGRTGSNIAINDKGLIYLMSSGPVQGPGDSGPGITGFLQLPYVSMTCDSVADAEAFLTSSTRMFGLNHMLADAGGNAMVFEATRARYGIRKSGDNQERDYLIATNHYLNPIMKPSQKIWDPLKFYPSSYYRYITVKKELAKYKGKMDYKNAAKIFSLTDWWDGRRWHRSDPWSANTINRFKSNSASLYSAIAVPEDHVLSICAGNPGMPYWGALTSDQTGTYVNLTVGSRPETLVYTLKSNATSTMWDTVRVMGKKPPENAAKLWAEIEDNYWKGVWWLDRSVLEKNATNKTIAWGRAATIFSGVIADSKKVQELCPKKNLRSAWEKRQGRKGFTDDITENITDYIADDIAYYIPDNVTDAEEQDIEQ